MCLTVALTQLLEGVIKNDLFHFKVVKSLAAIARVVMTVINHFRVDQRLIAKLIRRLD